LNPFPRHQLPARRRFLCVATAVALTAAACLAVLSPGILARLAVGGLIPAIILLAAYGVGALILRGLRLMRLRLKTPRRVVQIPLSHRPMAGANRLLAGSTSLETVPKADAVATRIIAIGLGLGALSLAVLGLGTLGALQRGLWWGIVISFALLGVAQAVMTRRGTPSPEQKSADRSPMLLWLAAIPFAALAVMVATLPPGMLWPEEANGYDVLEYHLAAPREFLERGAVVFLPHNIYANFPLNVEMLYLLTMILRGDPVRAALSANVLNLTLAALAVGAVWAAARPFGRGGATVAALLVAACPFVTYLSALAYVENAMMLFSALALAAFFRARSPACDAPRRCMLLSGLFAGLACGCKYTAVFATAVPLLVAALLAPGGSTRSRLRGLALLLIGAVLSFAPWLIRNLVNTGNPVFPLARSVFHERPGVWNDDGATRWREGHLPAPEHRSVPARLGRFGSEIVANPKFGWLLPLGILSAVGAIVASRSGPRTPSPSTAACWSLIVIGAVVWLSATHLVDRFAVLLIVPSAVLAGSAWQRLAQPEPGRLGTAVVLLVVLLNFSYLVRFCSAAHAFELAGGVVDDGTQWFTEGRWPSHAHVPRLNELCAEGKRTLMVGDARRFYLDDGVDYCVVFNRHPFAEAAQTASPDAVMTWLRDNGYDYVYVDWGEMQRLRRSRYGFWSGVDAALFDRLSAAGLKVVQSFSIDDRRGMYSTLYAVGHPRLDGPADESPTTATAPR